jgi:hypothetical protein
MWSLLAVEALEASRTRRQVWRNSFGKIQGHGQTVCCIPSPLPGLHDRRQSAGNGCGWPAAGVGRLLDLGAEVASRSCSRTHSIAVFQWATAVSCIAVHQSCISQQTKHATQHRAQLAEGFLSAALQ